MGNLLLASEDESALLLRKSERGDVIFGQIVHQAHLHNHRGQGGSGIGYASKWALFFRVKVNGGGKYPEASPAENADIHWQTFSGVSKIPRVVRISE